MQEYNNTKYIKLNQQLLSEKEIVSQFAGIRLRFQLFKYMNIFVRGRAFEERVLRKCIIWFSSSLDHSSITFYIEIKNPV